MKTIIMTGGGSSGHVTPNIALIPKLKELGYRIYYIGSQNGIEKQLIEMEKIPYYSINAGKLRRYLDFKNITDMLKVIDGFRQSILIIKKLKPNVIFSKGGFVSCPVVWAAWVCKVPVVIHESDLTPGLTNRLSIPFAKKVCYTFPETQKHIPGAKGILTGIPIRQTLFAGNKETGIKLAGFSTEKPIIMVIGGSQGAKSINNIVHNQLDFLLPKFQICHICGKGNINLKFIGLKGYTQFEYINNEQPHFFAMADLVVSRAGATTIFEILALRKPNLLIPLSKKTSRGDQILNARSFEKQGFSMVIEEEKLDAKTFIDGVLTVYNQRATFIKVMDKSTIGDGIDKIVNALEECMNEKIFKS